jgi:hypothetical protein
MTPPARTAEQTWTYPAHLELLQTGDFAERQGAEHKATPYPDSEPRRTGARKWRRSNRDLEAAQ